MKNHIVAAHNFPEDNRFLERYVSFRFSKFRLSQLEREETKNDRTDKTFTNRTFEKLIRKGKTTI